MTNGKADRRPGEFELIERLFVPLAQDAPGAFGLSDDVALLAPPPGHDIVLKTDAIVESVHFLHDDPPQTVAQKALRVNLSDLAAKGAVPAGYLMALLLPEWPDMAWLKAFARGLAHDQSEFGLSLMGGDTNATPGPLSVVISAFGLVPAGAIIRRAGAKVGDLVFVSGTVGDAAAGLAVLKAGQSSAAHEELIRRYRMPMPRLALGKALRGIASAALDVSDGLIADLAHMADVSHVRMTIDVPRIPLSASFQRFWGQSVDSVRRAATAGDDYEIAFTTPARCRDQVMAAAAQTGVPVSEIGRVEAGQGVVLLDAAGNEVPLARTGFTHF